MLVCLCAADVLTRALACLGQDYVRRFAQPSDIAAINRTGRVQGADEEGEESDGFLSSSDDEAADLEI